MAKANINQKVKSRKSLPCLSAFVEPAIWQPTTDNQQPTTIYQSQYTKTTKNLRTFERKEVQKTKE